MVSKALDNDYVSKYNQNTLSDDELKMILGGQPTYTASKDGKAVTLTKIDGSTIDSKSGKVISNTKADGSINISSNGGSAGLGAIMGNFGFIYDNKNINTQLTNSTINAAKGIDIYSIAGGTTNLKMIQGSAGIADYSGAFGYTYMNSNTTVGVAGSNLTNKSDVINIVAQDETSGKSNARGYQFGAAAVGTIFAKTNNTSKTNATVGKTKIANNSSAETASNTINISAVKNNKVEAEAHAGTVGGIGSHPSNRSDNEVTLNNHIKTEEGSLIKTTKKYGDINIATSYDFVASYTAYSEVEGSGGGSTSATSKYIITNNNKMDFFGDIYSKNDINLYTDRNTYGVKSNFNLYGNAEAYTRSIIPWKTDAILESEINRNNTINVNSNSLVRSVRHTTMTVDSGNFYYKPYTKEYTWYDEDESNRKAITTVDQGEEDDKLSEKNIINVDGKVIAGVDNKVTIDINGTVLFDESATGDGVVRKPTITCSSDEYEGQIKYGTMEYANRFYNRFKEIEKLIIENKGTLIGENYEAEKNRLIAEMEKYGLYDSKAKTLITNMLVDYIELPDIVGSGGNVYLNIKDGKKVTGNGLIQAKGAPEIKVNNNSNLYMVVNDLSVIDPGGEILLNNLSLGDKAKSTLAVKEAKTESADGSLIDVRQNWEGSIDVKYKESSTNKNKTVAYTPLSNLEINGHIDNPCGQVNFFNISKDIVIQGKSAKDSSSIQAKAISISAPKGSIAQGYTEGITNIGYSPEYVLLDYYKKLEEQISKGITSDYSDTLGKTLTLEEMTNYEEKYKTSGKNVNDSSSGVWLAGGSIFLNGDDININGTIQSGYSQFEANLDVYTPIITVIQSVYKIKGTPEVTDSYLKQNCKLNQGGMQWDSKSGSYKYIVQAYYNPQTDKIVLEDVSSKGGKIYITGRISNTSNGKIFAADGSSDINIINNTGKTLVANTLDVGDIQGLIRIMDLGKNTDEKGNPILGTLTEMTSKDTKVWYVTNQGQSENPNKVSGVSTEYNPKKGLTYNWSTGYQTVDEYTYNTVYGSEWWGISDIETTTWNTLKEKIEKNEITPRSINNQPMQSGTYIGEYTNLGNDDYQLYFLNNVNYKNQVSAGSTTEYGFLWWSKTTYAWATLRQGSTETFKHSIKADYPIKIGFLSGKGNINLNTNSDLQLNSNVTSKYGNVTLTSTNGSIEQTGGKINADNIWLNATNGIGNNNVISQQMQSTKGELSAITTNGDINLLSSNKAGEKNSSLKLTSTTDNGNVNVAADASLLNGSDNLSVKGSRIDLTSNYGSLGTSKELCINYLVLLCGKIV